MNPSGNSDIVQSLDAIRNAIVSDPPVVPHCHIYKTANQAMTAGVWGSIAFDVEEYDTTGMHDNVTNNSRITITSSGYYYVVGQLAWIAPNGIAIGARLRLNSLDNRTAASFLLAPASGDFTQNLTTVLYLTTGNYLELQGYCAAARSVYARFTGADAEFHTHLAVSRFA